LFCAPYNLDLKEVNFKKLIDNKIKEYVTEKKLSRKPTASSGCCFCLASRRCSPAMGQLNTGNSDVSAAF
jgi:hypothetical protein